MKPHLRKEQSLIYRCPMWFCRGAALEEAVLLLKKIEDGYGVLDRGLSDDEYSRMKQTAREHQVKIKGMK